MLDSFQHVNLQRVISPSKWVPNFSLSLPVAFVFLFSPQIIGGYATFLYQIGLLDEKQRKYFQKQCDACVKYIRDERWFQAFEVSSGARVALEQ